MYALIAGDGEMSCSVLEDEVGRRGSWGPPQWGASSVSLILFPFNLAASTVVGTVMRC